MATVGRPLIALLDLSGKVAIVSGAGHGLGFATAAPPRRRPAPPSSSTTSTGRGSRPRPDGCRPRAGARSRSPATSAARRTSGAASRPPCPSSGGSTSSSTTPASGRASRSSRRPRHCGRRRSRSTSSGSCCSRRPSRAASSSRARAARSSTSRRSPRTSPAGRPRRLRRQQGGCLERDADAREGARPARDPRQRRAARAGWRRPASRTRRAGRGRTSRSAAAPTRTRSRPPSSSSPRRSRRTSPGPSSCRRRRDARVVAEPVLLPLPTPFQTRTVNCWLLEGEPLTLVDPGPDWEETAIELDASLRMRGLRVEDVEQIVLTHQHLDHVGLATPSASRSGRTRRRAPLLRGFLADLPAVDAPRGRLPGRRDAAARRAGGAIGELYAVSEIHRRYGGSVQVDRLLHEGDIVETGGRASPSPSAPATARPTRSSSGGTGSRSSATT